MAPLKEKSAVDVQKSERRIEIEEEGVHYYLLPDGTRCRWIEERIRCRLDKDANGIYRWKMLVKWQNFPASENSWVPANEHSPPFDPVYPRRPDEYSEEEQKKEIEKTCRHMIRLRTAVLDEPTRKKLLYEQRLTQLKNREIQEIEGLHYVTLNGRHVYWIQKTGDKKKIGNKQFIKVFWVHYPARRASYEPIETIPEAFMRWPDIPPESTDSDDEDGDEQENEDEEETEEENGEENEDENREENENQVENGEPEPIVDVQEGEERLSEPLLNPEPENSKTKQNRKRKLDAEKKESALAVKAMRPESSKAAQQHFSTPISYELTTFSSPASIHEETVMNQNENNVTEANQRENNEEEMAPEDYINTSYFDFEKQQFCNGTPQRF